MLMDLQRNIQELRNEFRRNITEMKQTMEGLNYKMNGIEETVNINQRTGIERSSGRER